MLFVVLILCSVAFGQAAPQQTADKKPLTNSDIIMMVKAGLAESTILTALDQNYLALDTSPAALVEAKNQGVSPTIIESMIRANAPAPDQQPESSPEVAPQQQAPPPQTQAPLPGPRLTDAQVTQAIARGNGKRHRIGLTLIDQQTAFFSAMACTTCGQTGYIITIYTPEHWIELGAERAKGEMLPFGLPEITEDMRASILHVIALPSRAQYMTTSGMSLSSSVHRVVLNDTARQTTIQPLTVEHGTMQSNSTFRSIEYTSASVDFLMSDVTKLRASDSKGEFFVVVVGDKQNKFFKVKSRDFKQLFSE